MLAPFHLAIPVTNLEEAKNFYESILGCKPGREDERWIDYNFYGHQLVCHLINEQAQPNQQCSNPVDGHGVPIPHFGVVLTMPEWYQIADKLKKRKVRFIIEPYIRFEGLPGEQATLFIQDPSGNAIELKAFKDRDSELFAK